MLRPSSPVWLRPSWNAFKPRRLHDGQVGWRCALENPAHIHASMPISIKDAGAITDQPANGRKLAPLIDRRDRIACGERNEPIALAVKKRITADKKSAGPLLD